MNKRFSLYVIFFIWLIVGFLIGYGEGAKYTICENCPGFNASVDDWLDRPEMDCYAPVETMVCVPSGSPVHENMTILRGGG